MTDKTKDPHAELMRLADDYAEARHVNGDRSYNTKAANAYRALNAYARTLTDRIAGLEADRDEWKEATESANERFKIAERKADALEAQLEAVGAMAPKPCPHKYFYFGPDEQKRRRCNFCDALEPDPAQPAPAVVGPVPMILHCPSCGVQHIDAPDGLSSGWSNPPHRSHLCLGCGHIWRPADVATTGVIAIKTHGAADSPTKPHQIAEPASKAAKDVLAERERQISVEGWTPKHDDEHDSGQLAGAAACYARHINARSWVVADLDEGLEVYRTEPAQDYWPWDESWWKPTTPRRDAVKACALLLAEIERIDRATTPKEPS